MQDQASETNSNSDLIKVIESDPHAIILDLESKSKANVNEVQK